MSDDVIAAETAMLIRRPVTAVFKAAVVVVAAVQLNVLNLGPAWSWSPHTRGIQRAPARTGGRGVGHGGRQAVAAFSGNQHLPHRPVGEPGRLAG